MKKRTTKKTTSLTQKGLALLLAVIMTLGILPGTVFAVTVQEDIGTPPLPSESQETETTAAVETSASAEDSDTTTAQKEESIADIELSNEEIMLFAGEHISVIRNNTSLNATVKVFNYDGTVNTRKDGLGPNGYVFFQGDYADDAKEGSVDGVNNSEYTNSYNKPKLQATLKDGYPYVLDTNVTGSMKYLFSDEESYHKGTMTDGGGLFQVDGDGYYYYDSLKNAAYYNDGRFTLYNSIVSPKYVDDSQTDVYRSNFLPFNDPTKSTSAPPLTNGTNAAKLNDPVDLWFGMTVQFDFFMPKDGLVNGKDMIFDFHGDDDVFVYIDDVLVLDIGGTHGAESGNINFKTGVATDPNGNKNGRTLKKIFDAAGKTGEFEGDTFGDYTKHTLKFFYMERGGNISYCRLRFNMPTLPENALMIGKELSVDDGTAEGGSEIKDYLYSNLVYRFRVWKADDEGKKTDDLLIKNDDVFTLMQNGTAVKTRTVGADGIIELKATQQAQFEDLFVLNGKHTGKYIVEELIPTDLKDQYGEVEYELSSSTSTIINGETGEETEFTSYFTPAINILDQNSSEIVTFTNKVDISKLSLLRITKKIAAGSENPGDTEFPMQIKLDGVDLPVGTKYLIAGESEPKQVENAGIIELKAGQTATLVDGIISGTAYEISEQTVTGWNASYSGTVTDANNAVTNVTVTNGIINGTFPLNSTVHAVVTNATYDFSCEVPFTKIFQGNPDDNSVTFDFEVREVKQDGSVIQLPGESITVTGSTKAEGKIVIGLKSDMEDGDYTFKITEKAGEDKTVIYDDTVYTATVTVSTVEDVKTAELKEITKDDQKIDSASADFVNIQTTSITIKKWVDGNMGDRSKEFTFQTNFEGDPEFVLKHSETHTIEKIPVGTKLTISESNSDYTVTVVQVDAEGKTTVEFDESYTGTAIEGNQTATVTVDIANVNNTVLFTNTKNVTIDTGISLDSIPYILILVGVIGAGAFLFLRRRRSFED